MGASAARPRLRTAVVLGAGGPVGHAFHLGVLQALGDLTGFDPRQAGALVGTSAGSIVAAGLAGGMSAHDMAAEVLGEPVSAEGRALRSASRGRRNAPATPPLPPRRPLAAGVLLAAARRPWAVRPGAVASSLIPPGRQPIRPLNLAVGRLHGDRWPDRDLRLCALRARDARRVVFGTPGAPEVDVGSAVAASCAVPGWFSPVRIGDETYVDGGGHSPTNADVLVRDRPELVLVLSPMSARPGAMARRPDAALRVAVRRYLAQEVRKLRRAGAEVVVLQPGSDDLRVMGLNAMAMDRTRDVLRTAAASTRGRLEAQPALVDLLSRA